MRSPASSQSTEQLVGSLISGIEVAIHHLRRAGYRDGDAALEILRARHAILVRALFTDRAQDALFADV